MFENFKVYNLTVGTPAMSITKNGVTFNKASIAKIDYARYVIVLIDEANKCLAIKVSDEDDENSQAFVIKPRKEAANVRWNYRDFTKTLAKMMEWDIEAGKSYRVSGEYIKDENALLFDFTKAEEIFAEEG